MQELGDFHTLISCLLDRITQREGERRKLCLYCTTAASFLPHLSMSASSKPRSLARDELEKGRKGEIDVRRPVKEYDGGTTSAAAADDDGQGNQQK